MEFYNTKTKEIYDNETSLRLSFPEIGFPRDFNSECLAEINVVQVQQVDAPSPSAITKKVTRNGVVKVGNAYKQNWKESALTTAEKNAYTQTVSANIRAERNLLLKESDWTVLADSPLSTTKQNEWKAYRKTLRDIPSDSGFPHSITFPTKPS